MNIYPKNFIGQTVAEALKLMMLNLISEKTPCFVCLLHSIYPVVLILTCIDGIYLDIPFGIIKGLIFVFVFNRN